MASPKAVLKSVGPKLVPFFKTVAIYFVVFIPEENISWFACLIKCLPVMSLVAFVLLHGMNLKDEYQYSRRVLIGLLFSCLGDVIMIDTNNNLIAGILCFSVAHICYTLAFGFRPLKPFVGLFCFVFALITYFVLTPGLQGIMLPATLVYLLMITTMVWRAIARVQFFDDLWTWTKLCGCAGAIMFFISDTTLAINAFLKPLPYSQAIIMGTYYIAQLGIALSVVDSMNERSSETLKGSGFSEPQGYNVITVDASGPKFQRPREKAN